MTFFLLFSVLFTASSSDALWQLRSGSIPDQTVSVSFASSYAAAIEGLSDSMDLETLRDGLASGRENMLFPLASRLVRSGSPGEAELYWVHSKNPPASRGELLAALSWYGRFQLYSLMSARGETPSDMEGRLHDEHCAAVCSAGWMAVRKDGLFHPEELVQKGDLILLSEYFPRFYGFSFLPLSELDQPPEEGD